MTAETQPTIAFFQELELAVLNTDYRSQPALVDRFIAAEFEEINNKGAITRREDVVTWLLNKEPGLPWV